MPIRHSRVEGPAESPPRFEISVTVPDDALAASLHVTRTILPFLATLIFCRASWSKLFCLSKIEVNRS